MPSSLYVPNQNGGFTRGGAEELDRLLREGDGVVWSGDPTLWLGEGIIEETRGGAKTGRVARRWEVWRHTEQGEDVMIGSWNPSEFDRILHDVAIMKAGAEGKIPSAVDRIDAHNAQIEKDNDDHRRQIRGEMMDHATRLFNDREMGKTTFRGIPGRRDEK